jgi:hypothetical protein
VAGEVHGGAERVGDPKAAEAQRVGLRADDLPEVKARRAGHVHSGADIDAELMLRRLDGGTEDPSRGNALGNDPPWCHQGDGCRPRLCPFRFIHRAPAVAESEELAVKPGTAEFRER